MRVLITWGTRIGGTECIARTIGEVLSREGFDVTLSPAGRAGDVRRFDAAIIGGAIYANRWHRDARRFVANNAAALRAIPVFLFSSAPLDHGGDRRPFPPSRHVTALMDRLGARGHVTFGGRPHREARLPSAGAATRARAPDSRNEGRIRAWATDLAEVLPRARIRCVGRHHGPSPLRLLGYGVGAWAACALVTLALLRSSGTAMAAAALAILTPVVFTVVTVAHLRHARLMSRVSRP
jgi:menaquinone-dependent protoporphyrinogen oxidase